MGGASLPFPGDSEQGHEVRHWGTCPGKQEQGAAGKLGGRRDMDVRRGDEPWEGTWISGGDRNLGGDTDFGGLGRHGQGKGHGPQRRALISVRDMGLGRGQDLDHMKAVSPPLPWRG